MLKLGIVYESYDTFRFNKFLIGDLHVVSVFFLYI